MLVHVVPAVDVNVLFASDAFSDVAGRSATAHEAEFFIECCKRIRWTPSVVCAQLVTVVTARDTTPLPRASATQAPLPSCGGPVELTEDAITDRAAIPITCTTTGAKDTIDVFTAQTGSFVDQLEDPTQ